MAFRALLFSNNPETNTALANASTSAGIRLEVCRDIFSAIEKATKQPFSAILADWSNQPEAGFLLKRARESSRTKDVVAIAIVDHEPTEAEVRDHRLEFLIYRPIVATEAEEVFAKAAERMDPVATGTAPEPPPEPENHEPLIADAADSSQPSQDSTQSNEVAPAELPETENGGDADVTADTVEEMPVAPRRPFPFRQACAVALLLATTFCLWNARDNIIYLARTREGRVKVLTESLAAFWDLNSSGSQESPASSEAQDAYPSRNASRSDAQSSQIKVVASEAELGELPIRLSKPADFPLPTPIYEPPPPVPIHVERGAVPDSLRGSAPITRPVVVTVTPAQMMPVSIPAVPPLPQPFSEPVAVSEDAARALLVHSVNPTYPPEAASQKLHGPVVLQATISREGSVEDLKIVRGNFVLSKAAIAAVKQWRFQPYMQSGRAAQAQTLLTINF